MLLDEIARTSATVADTPARLTKIERLSACLRRLGPKEIPIAVAYLSGDLPQGAIGVGWASLRDLPPPAAPPPTLELFEVDATLRGIGTAGGAGSQSLRRSRLEGLYARATDAEQRFLSRLLVGELRQGALQGVMVEAVAKATGVPPSEVRRATMVVGDLGAVAAAAAAGGRVELGRFHLTVLRPVQPMLAQTAEDLQDALRRIHPAGVEWKIDGARIQVHRLGAEVRVFTRNLADVTARVPDVVEEVRRLPVTAAILDGEAIALRSDGRPHPFQITMGRFGSKLAVDEQRRAVPLHAFFFDCLHLDGTDLIDRPADERIAALAPWVPRPFEVPRIVAYDARKAQVFLDAALKRGHEGVMVKALAAPYEAGRRGASWLKVKRAHTLDLVVLAAEWGHGRRRGWLSNLHLGARDPGSGGFVMLGKTFKGMTDEMLTWQTEYLQKMETGRDAYTVYVRPELVVEVAVDGVQASPRDPGGVALRVARGKGYRPDKRPEEADTIDTVRAIHAGLGQPPPKR